jgi:glutamate synthase (NADPH) small chain
MATPVEQMTKLSFRRFEDGNEEWGGWDEKIFVQDTSHKCPTYVHRTPPCQGSCPSGHDIRGWLDIVRGVEKPPKDVSWQEYAFRRATNANPFPSIMGRVCPAPCEDGCNRNQLEDHVGINSVEQFIGDFAIQNGFKFETPAQETGKKVAVIGGGPGGMAAAYQLRRLGHGVTVFEEHERLGGMMVYGIPGYRVPRDVLDAEMKRILDIGVQAKLNTRVGRDISVEQLEKDFDAILWAIGTHKGRMLPAPGFDAPNCLGGVEFLRAFNKGLLQVASPRVVVVGGGDTSIDVASVARRLGHIGDSHDKDRPENVVMGHTAHDVAATAKREGATVTLTSLFPIENMTAAEHEREDAKREGIEIKGGVMPLEMIKDASGRAVAMKLCECTMDGMKPIPKAGTEFTIEADLFVSAIGQMGDMSGLEALDNGRGFINADNHYQVPGKAGHFAIGDIVRPHLLTTAIGQASVATESIDHYLKSAELGKRPKVDVHHFDLLQKLREAGLNPDQFDPAKGDQRGTADAKYAVHNFEDRSAAEIITHEELFLGHFQFTPRVKRKEIHISAEEVLGNFKERLIGLSETEAQSEAKRCMSCGMCFECDNCVVYCPQTAVYRVNKKESTTGRYVATDYTKCIGCHICFDVCPTGYIQMGLGE